MNLRPLDLGFFALLVGCALLGACDPVHQQAIQRLGGEDPRVGTGPLHRAGQPCLVCHAPGGPGANFSVAGTIFQRRDALVDGAYRPQRDPAIGTQVVLTDARGRSYTAVTNRAGNFYLTSAQFDPIYPLLTKLCTGAACDPLSDPPTAVPMKTHIGRDGSCASCHQDPEGLESAGHIYLIDTVAAP